MSTRFRCVPATIIVRLLGGCKRPPFHVEGEISKVRAGLNAGITYCFTGNQHLVSERDPAKIEHLSTNDVWAAFGDERATVDKREFDRDRMNPAQGLVTIE